MFQQLGFPLIRPDDRPIIFLVEQKQIPRLWFWFWVQYGVSEDEEPARGHEIYTGRVSRASNILG